MSAVGHITRGAVALCTAAALAGLVACGSSTSSGSGSSSPTPSSSTSSSVSVAPPPSATAPTVASAPAASSAAGSQPPSGSASVGFGQSSLVALTDFTTEKTHPIKLALSLKTGSLADLKNFQLDAQTKKSTPYYLSINITNVGTAAIDSSGFAGLLTVDDSAGDEVSILTLLGDFAKCDGSIPDKLKPGASAAECDVYTVPMGDHVASASITNGSGSATVTWK